MSCFILVNSPGPKGENQKVIIKTDWIISVSGSVNKGSYIVVAEDNAITVDESIEDVVSMLESDATVSRCTREKKKPMKVVKNEIQN